LAQENHDWLKLTKRMTFGISSLNLACAILRMEKYTFGFPFLISALSLLISKHSDTVYFLWVIDWFIFLPFNSDLVMPLQGIYLTFGFTENSWGKKIDLDLA
jgi:hypothetical protein